MNTEVKVSPSCQFDWFSLLAKYGFATFISCVLLYFLAFYIVIPMRDDQKLFMQSVIKTNELDAESRAGTTAVMQKMAQLEQAQSITLATLVDQQKQTTAILSQIRDDQRAGAWLKPQPKSER